MNRAKRNSSIEVLRIIAMLFIVCSHFSVHGNYNFEMVVEENFFSAIILKLSVLGYVGIDIFMCIYGFFNIREQNYRKTIIRVFRIALQVFFYSFFIYLFFLVSKQIPFSYKEMIKAILPLSFDVIVSLISPLINGGVLSLSREQRMILIIVVLLIWTVIPTVSLGHINHYGTTLSQYILLYIIGGFIRIEITDDNSKKRIGGLFIVLSFLGILLTAIISTILRKESLITVFLSRYSCYSVLLACGLVMVFSSFSYNSKLINKLASLTFGVYLIHDNRLIRERLWTEWLKCERYSLSSFFPLYELLVVVFVFFICLIIEFVRQVAFERMNNKISISFCNILSHVFHRLFVYFNWDRNTSS